MPAFTYLTSKQKKIQSKYHRVARRFESQYESIHRELKLMFHREPTETELIRYKINNLIAKSKESIESTINSTKFISAFSRTSTKKNDMFYPDIIDWFQGRFSGQIIRIIVRDGKIIEKIFVSLKGNQISVKRSKLELRIRSIPTFQIKLRLRIRSMPNIQNNLNLIGIKGIKF
tara:strand:+ start:357 stop:878 length:522 start_codon:yes stop_codon:yes gene_type:complete